ncbi:hypothetical protein Pcinc_025666 [Petrolisthes cinctipes]|uniref:Uncharacterized protein n=1 Tax=Petrolisthes cinctipes TaxID=88211 RepID=A0AAE1FA18_PETCI|nr:hypothetical protein Pcinc_025666 [Petrolisthes cinctipes]
MNLKSKGKEDIIQRKQDHIKTGGGKPKFKTSMDAVTDTIASILGPDNVNIGGVGGIGSNDVAMNYIVDTEESDPSRRVLAGVEVSGGDLSTLVLEVEETPGELHPDDVHLPGSSGNHIVPFTQHSTPTSAARKKLPTVPCTPLAPPMMCTTLDEDRGDEGGKLKEECWRHQREALIEYKQLCLEQQKLCKMQQELCDLQCQYYKNKMQHNK